MCYCHLTADERPMEAHMGIKKWKAEIVQTHNLGSTLDGDVFGRHRITDADGRVVVEGDMAGKDAKAIAAVPAMLAALDSASILGDRSVAADIRGALRPHERESFDHLIATIREAIATAEGR